MALPLAVATPTGAVEVGPCASNAGNSVPPIALTTVCLTSAAGSHAAATTAVFPVPPLVTVNGGLPTKCTLFTEIYSAGGRTQVGTTDCTAQAPTGGPVVGAATLSCTGQSARAYAYLRLVVDGSVVYVGDSGFTPAVACT